MPENPESLSPSEWKLLQRGMDIYLDLLLDDLCSVLSGEALKDTMVLGDVLPSQFTSWYTPLFLRRQRLSPRWAEGKKYVYVVLTVLSPSHDLRNH